MSYVVPATVVPLDQGVYDDGRPEGSAVGRGLVRNDACLHANCGRVVCNEALRPLAATMGGVGLFAANAFVEEASTAKVWWLASQGRRRVRYFVRATIPAGLKVICYPETSATAPWPQCRDNRTYTQILIGTGAEQTYGFGATGPYTAPIRPGEDNFFRLHFLPDQGDIDALAPTHGTLSSISADHYEVTDSISAPAPFLGWGQNYMLRVVDRAPGAPGTPLPMTTWYQVEFNRAAGRTVRLMEPLGSHYGERPLPIYYSVQMGWEGVQLYNLVELWTVYAVEDALTSADLSSPA